MELKGQKDYDNLLVVLFYFYQFQSKNEPLDLLFHRSKFIIIGVWSL
jgi:hypothetical protein